MTTFTKIKFGDGLGVTDEGGGAIRVDAAGSGGGGGGTTLQWEDVGGPLTAPPVGIQFGVANLGNWLDVTASGADSGGFAINLTATNSAVKIDATHGIELHATGSGNGILLYADDFLFSGAETTADFVVQVGGNMLLHARGSAQSIDLGVDIFQLYASLSDLNLVAVGSNRIQLWATDGDVEIKGRYPGEFAARAILRVSHNGTDAPTYHIATGATWVADL